MKIRQYMAHGVSMLIAHGWPENYAIQSINYAMRQVLDCSWSTLFIQQDQSLDIEQQKSFLALLHRLVCEHKPLAYELGSVPFLDCTIMVQPPILIPRQETEGWCHDVIGLIQAQEQVPELTHFKQQTIKNTQEPNTISYESQSRVTNVFVDNGTEGKNITIIDMCCGSGCIGIALAKALPQAQVYAADISSHACGLTHTNALYNAVNNITVIRSDLFNELMHLRGTVDYIVSNPPYVSYAEWLAVEPSVREWEDYHALVAPEEGFLYIKAIVERARTLLRKKSIIMPRIWIEIGAAQGSGALAIAQNAGFAHCSLLYDASGKARVLQIAC